MPSTVSQTSSAPDAGLTGPTVSLTKHHGLANDFLVALEPSRPLTSADATRWCDRHTGIGADGLISAVPVATSMPGATNEGAPGAAHWLMTLFNADGSEAEISGNGIRCLTQAIADHVNHDRSGDLEVQIESGGRTRSCTVLARRSGADPDLDQVRVGMGKALDGPGPSGRFEQLGVSVGTQVGVDMGNPHLVAFVDAFPAESDADLSDIARIGPVVEADYGQGCNIHLVQVVDRKRLVMKIWERGAGVTQACGSGASAAAWAAVGSGLVDQTADAVQVDMPGGAVKVEVDGDEVVLIGPTVRIAGIEIR